MEPTKATDKSGNVSDFGIALENNIITEDSFEKYYNKELDLDEGNIHSLIFQDEVPTFLHELNDSALNYIAREGYDKGLILLQKA
jgi:hypothetical protein